MSCKHLERILNLEKEVEDLKKELLSHQKASDCMDELQYEQYKCVLINGQLSLDALKRIIKHDKASGWENTPGGLARVKVAMDCDRDIITPMKFFDEKSDQLYGNSWPLPLEFKRR